LRGAIPPWDGVDAPAIGRSFFLRAMQRVRRASEFYSMHWAGRLRINYGGKDGNSSTFTTTYSSYDSSNRTSPSPTCLKAAGAWSEKSSTIATTDRAN
jgi:hypothetical protein